MGVDLRTAEGRKLRPELMRRACEMRDEGALIADIGAALKIAPATASALIWEGGGPGFAIATNRASGSRAAQKALQTKGLKPTRPSRDCEDLLGAIDADWRHKHADIGLAAVAILFTFGETGEFQRRMFPFTRHALASAHQALVDHRYLVKDERRWKVVAEEGAEDCWEVWFALCAATCEGSLQRILET